MHESIEQVYQNHAKYVFRYLYSLCHDKDWSEEMTQETFYRAFRSIEKYNQTCKIEVWLCQIAKHIWYQELEKRKKNHTVELEENISSPAQSPEDILIMAEEKMMLYKAINSLPGPMKDVVYLRISGEFSFAEIGEVLGKSEAWARLTFYRAKKKIQEVI